MKEISDITLRPFLREKTPYIVGEIKEEKDGEIKGGGNYAGCRVPKRANKGSCLGAKRALEMT